MKIEGGDDNMDIELMNIFHLYFRNGRDIALRCNCTKKQLTEDTSLKVRKVLSVQ